MRKPITKFLINVIVGSIVVGLAMSMVITIIVRLLSG